jgi:hypothetical protein
MVILDSLLAIVAFLIAAALVVLRRRTVKAKGKTSDEFGRLSDVVKSAEVANDGFFRALELVQKNLEALIVRAESTEQRLRGLMLHPGIDRREQYTAAALLLAEGQDAERVAAMLNLPLAQVHLIRDLQQVTSKEKRSRPKGTEEFVPAQELLASKPAASREKNSSRPILLVDAIKTAAGLQPTSEPTLARGITA